MSIAGRMGPEALLRSWSPRDHSLWLRNPVDMHRRCRAGRQGSIRGRCLRHAGVGTLPCSAAGRRRGGLARADPPDGGRRRRAQARRCPGRHHRRPVASRIKHEGDDGDADRHPRRPRPDPLEDDRRPLRRRGHRSGLSERDARAAVAAPRRCPRPTSQRTSGRRCGRTATRPTGGRRQCGRSCRAGNALWRAPTWNGCE